MKVTIIHGQSHKGSTYHISKILADKIGGEVKEFFLPRDFGEFCIGCTQCFRKSETLCPHYEKINPLTEALDEAALWCAGIEGCYYNIMGLPVHRTAQLLRELT